MIQIIIADNGLLCSTEWKKKYPNWFVVNLYVCVAIAPYHSICSTLLRERRQCFFSLFISMSFFFTFAPIHKQIQSKIVCYFFYIYKLVFNMYLKIWRYDNHALPFISFLLLFTRNCNSKLRVFVNMLIRIFFFFFEEW